ncbi:hypothetical protein [Mammaliicoccus sciuri]|nr:hypothetical protein [Mammaliicoccus sciuri]
MNLATSEDRNNTISGSAIKPATEAVFTIVPPFQAFVEFHIP